MTKVRSQLEGTLKGLIPEFVFCPVLENPVCLVRMMMIKVKTLNIHISVIIVKEEAQYHR